MADAGLRLMTAEGGAPLATGTVRPAYFGPAGRRRFGVLHEPLRRCHGARVLVVCAPHFEEKLWAHRVLLDLANRACASGHPVFRFDFSGHGDSEGEFEAFGFRDLEQDVAEAVAHARRVAGAPAVLIGLRLGGTLAGRYAAENGMPVALWAPVVDVDAWMHDTLRANLTFQVRRFGKVLETRARLIEGFAEGRAVLIEGYGLTPAFWTEAAASGGLLPPRFPGLAPSVLLVHIRKPGASASPAPWQGAPSVAVADVVDDPFWSDTRRHRNACPAAVQATLEWLASMGESRS